MIATINERNKNINIMTKEAVYHLDMVNWLIGSLEGYKAQIYKDIAGHLTIGYGHEISNPFEKDNVLAQLNLSYDQLVKGIDQETGFKILTIDLLSRANIYAFLNKQIVPTISHTVALTSFCFNVGEGNFQNSDVLKHYNLGHHNAAADSLSSWRKADQQFSEGIAKRRLCEVMIFLQKPLCVDTPLLPTAQFGSSDKMTYTDENWLKLSSDHKNEAIKIYDTFVRKFMS